MVAAMRNRLFNLLIAGRSRTTRPGVILSLRRSVFLVGTDLHSVFSAPGGAMPYFSGDFGRPVQPP